ncbi:hypothetical protein [uncultured Aquimarina sp.]|uniref:hypothetical protein n=1 Tax=uncultured Aquimarina sp. TaxID=575652 RepID=UPI00260FF103|nr:hypothetical protein [uncultured Aquimarina sp.]
MTFKKADTGNLGKELYVIVETKLLQGKTMGINIRQGKRNPIIKSDTINFGSKKLQSLRELKVPFLFEE